MSNAHNTNEHHAHHITPIAVYVKTLLALLVLTVLTVAASYMDFGKANIFVSLGIATVKAALVMMFFMGLKYDNALNRVVILSSFLALALFLWLSASDLWTRMPETPVKVVSAAGALGMDDIKKLEASTPELVAKGKEIFNVNCAVCHGAEGKGDGVGGQALNPKPRNFHLPASAWKNGTSGKSIYVTLSYGIPGSGMAAYKSLPPGDRWALVHYVQTWTPEIQAAGPADARYAQALKEDGVGEGGGAAGGAKQSIPIDFAIKRLTQ